MNKKNIVWILLFGSMWGLNELVIGRIFYKANVGYSSVWLTVWAFLILAMARGLLNKPGSSMAIAAVAVAFKSLYATPYFCHLYAIFLIGVAFDLAASFLIKNERRGIFWRSLTGMIAVFGGYAFFAVSITYVIRYEHWIAVGLPKVLNHIFISGSFAALAAIVVVPLGFWIGMNAESLRHRRPRLAHGCGLLVLLFLWILGWMVV